MAKPEPRRLAPDRQRLGQAFAWIIGLTASGVGIVGIFTIWHLSRRARLIRETLAPPKPLPPLEIPESPEN